MSEQFARSILNTPPDMREADGGDALKDSNSEVEQIKDAPPVGISLVRRAV